jgi:hypothetical protein
MLADRWNKLIFVRYPQGRNLPTVIDSLVFSKGQVHRNAGLERVAVLKAGEA